MVMLRSGVLALAMVVSAAAVEPLRQAIAPSDSSGFKAYFAAANGRADDALAHLTNAIRRHPDSYMAYYRRGVTLAHKGKLEPALADLDTAVRLSPEVKNANELGVRVWNSLSREAHALHTVILVRAARADVYKQLQRYDEAVADLTAAIALDPRRTGLRHGRALIYMDSGNAAAAVADFNALLARRENVEWRFARGMSHLANGDLRSAEADFVKATEADPSNPLYARWLARTQQRRGIPV